MRFEYSSTVWIGTNLRNALERIAWTEKTPSTILLHYLSYPVPVVGEVGVEKCVMVQRGNRKVNSLM